MPAGTPHDWFEIKNTSDAPIDLSDFGFVDHRGELNRVRRFRDLTLSPGAHHVQEVIREECGFQLGRSEGLWIYRWDDRVLIDGVTWAPGGKGM